ARLSGTMALLEGATRGSMRAEGAAEGAAPADGPDSADAPPAAEGIRVHRWIDARYRGQSFELAVPADDWIERFHRAHEARYGYRRDDTPVEAVTVRVVVERPAAALPVQELAAATGLVPTATVRVL